MNAFPNRRPESSPTVVEGMAPPHSLEAESALLGAVLLTEKPMYQYIVADNIRPDDFYRDRHQLIFAAMLELYEAGEPIDRVTVVEQLRSKGKLDEVGGEGTVNALAAAPPAIGNLRRFVQTVK